VALLEADRAGRTPLHVAQAREAAKARERSAEVDDERPLTAEEQERYAIVRRCRKVFESARKTRKPHETFDLAWSLFTGDVWSPRRPPWRAAITINKIYSFIMFMVAIMTDNKPRISVEPLVPGSEDAADLLRKLSDRDWDDNDMQTEITVWALYGLIFGYAFLKVWYDPYANGGRGEHKVDVVPPYKVYTNGTAKDTTFKGGCEYIIHVEQMTMGWIRRNFPNEAKFCEKLKGMRSFDGSDDILNRDLIREGDAKIPRILSAMQVDRNTVLPQASQAHPNYMDNDHETVEIAEYWLRDDTWEEYREPIVENGRMKMVPQVEHGVAVMEVVGEKIITSDIDGALISVPDRQPKMVPATKSAWRLKYPNGRLVVIAGGRVLLRDIPNPYQTDGFPWAMWKDTDIGSIYGQGEPLRLRSCATAINKIASQVYEILQKTGNPGWKVKKGAGVNTNAITGQPGQCVPMEDTREGLVPMDKPQIPGEFFTLFEVISKGMAEVSGINDAVTGTMKADNTGFATIDQLQESSSAPIRLKVRNFESGIRRFGKLRIQLIQQYDQGESPLRIQNDFAPGVSEPAGNTQVQFRRYNNNDLQGQIEFNVVPISSLSTSPASQWNKWMTMLEKGLIDITAWHEKHRIESWKTTLPRMLAQKELDAEREAATKRASKVGGSKTSARSAAQSRRAPPSQGPSAQQNAMVR
jgi:hypothetical protein